MDKLRVLKFEHDGDFYDCTKMAGFSYILKVKTNDVFYLPMDRKIYKRVTCILLSGGGTRCPNKIVVKRL